MAIQFARCEYVSRSSGGNACRKASYNQRETIRCEKTGELFSFKERAGNVHHEILLPVGTHEKFKNSAVLWNEVEASEKRINSQLAKEFVLALPDDRQVNLEDRVELTRRFAHLFVEKGVAVQLDVHAPHDGEKNWHAHLLVTTRRFSEDGLTFGNKARDLDPIIRGGKVVEANLWGEVWRDLQNAYFEEKGYDLRVDPIGIVPQEHLGPVRMRHHLNEAVLRSQMLQKANEALAQHPKAVLEEITHTRAVFSKKDVELFLHKHVPAGERRDLLERILSHDQVLPLYDRESGQQAPYFTTKLVRAEEEKLVRFADAIAHNHRSKLSAAFLVKGLENKTLSFEQKKAYDLCVSSGQNLTIIQGRAGVGKSYTLNAIREAHETSGYRVLGLAPTHKVALDLNKDGFQEAKTCHSFLFRYKNGREKLNSNTLIVVDEAGMLGTTLSVELFNVVKNSGAKLILVGDDRQLQSVERGGTFKFLAERYGAAELQEVRRQTIDWQKAVSEELSKGNIKDAVCLLEENKAISWSPTKEEAFAELLKAWAQDNLLNPHKTRLILAQKNVDVDALNQGARDVLRSRGQLGELEIVCSTQRGRVIFAEGDRVQFTKTDKEQGLTNGSFGIIEHIDPQTKIIKIQLDKGGLKQVDPHTYDGLRHGYASTVYKAQGGTLDHVYVLHNKTTNKTTNYVALTRQTRSLHLYVSQDETPSQAALVHQMSRQDENGTSLFFHTQKDMEKSQAAQTWSTELKHLATGFLTKAQDFFHANENFYRYENLKGFAQEKAEIVLSSEPLLPLENEGHTLEKPVPSLARKAPNNFFFIDAKTVEEALRQNMAAFADDVLSSIGEPYCRASSSAHERRYGKKGHIAVNLTTGAWIDYKDDTLSGGPLHMLTKLKGLSFKEAVEYGASWAGLSAEKKELPRSFVLRPHYKDTPHPEKNDAVRIERARTLWEKGQPTQGTFAERYLREHRKIEGALPSDLRYLPAFKDQRSGVSYPCLMSVARSPEGEVTAVQLTYLDPQTAAKAKIDTPKKSFGVLKGSAVTIQKDKASNVLFIAEGLETALSLRSAGIQGTIKASLGLSNIKRLTPDSPATHVVICADHDTPDSSATKSLEKSVLALREKGFNVTVIKPHTLHEDFNDVLKNQGPEGVREFLATNLPNDLLKIFSPQEEASPQAPIIEEKHFNKKIIDIGTTRSPQKSEEKNTLLGQGPRDRDSLNQGLLNQELSQEKSSEKSGTAVFEELAQRCLQKLYTYLREEKRNINPELIKRVVSQAEKAANFIFHAHTLKETQPTEKETKQFLLRAKYELNRIPEIRQELIHKWQKASSYKVEKDELIAHMIAERQASIEGRMYLETKQKGLMPSPAISILAAQELKVNRSKTEALAQELMQMYDLSTSAATFCAKDILRHQESHGEKPTASQINHMSQISKELDKKGYGSLKSHEAEYFRRQEGDSLFRQACVQDMVRISLEYKERQRQRQIPLEVPIQHMTQAYEKRKQMDMSL